MAYFGFQRAFTEINNSYWGGLPGVVLARRMIRNANPNDDLAATLGASPRDLRRVGTTVREAQAKLDVAERSRRIGAVVYLLSAVEVLVVSLTVAAERSDPLLGYRPTTGAPPVDGFLVRIARRRVVEIPEHSFTRGSWPDRIRRLSHFFSLDNSSFPELARLERARRLRNTFAHEFNRVLETSSELSSRLGLHLVEPQSVSEDWLKKLFADADQFAATLDRQLVRNHIGSYEAVALYHEWLTAPAPVATDLGYSHQMLDPRHHGIREFRKLVNHAFPDSGRGADYFTGLRDYYRRSLPR